MVRQDIRAGRGLCLVDPHGELVAGIERWCATRGLGRTRRIHLIRPGDPNQIPGFNPLREVPGEEASVRVDYMVAACAQAWGVKNLSETPRLEKILRALFYVLRIHGLTLAEGPALLRAADPDGIRRALTEHLPGEDFQIIWDELNGLSRKDFAEHVESTITRLSKFLTSPAIRLIVGQSTRSIDFRAAMDNGEIVLVDLGASQAFSRESASLLGGLLINDLFLSALGRDVEVAKRRPFTLYVDEAYQYLSGDVERILDETRKYGLHAVLAHQRLGQLRSKGEAIYNAVMGCTHTKIVLGGLSDDDASIMAKEIMRGDIDLSVPKSGLTMPVVVGEQLTWLQSESASRGTAETTGTNSSSGTAFGSTSSEGSSGGVDGQIVQLSSSSGISSVQNESFGTSESYTTSENSSHGRSQSFRSVREERATQLYSLEESFHLATLRIRNLPDRTAIVKRRGRKTVQIRTIDVPSALDVPNIMRRFRDRAALESSCISSRADAEAEIMMRRQRLLPHSAVREDTFWQPET
ncbi:MAG TPA: TraM recognition domain-containing protein [Rhizomicrobium sp.]